MPKYTENDLQQAVREVHQGTSQRSAAKRWHIPRATLQDRLNGGISHAEAHECRQRFSRQQEALLSRWIEHLADLGVPPTQNQFEEFASRVLVVHGDTQPLGKHWVQGFLRRNADVKLVKGFLFPSPRDARSASLSSASSSCSHPQDFVADDPNPTESAWDALLADPDPLFDPDSLADMVDWTPACFQEYAFPLVQ